MRLALISDIHGNEIALERVIASIAGDGSDGIVCLGDVAGTGPQPAAALERMRAIGAPVVMGNVDSYMLYPESAGSPGNEMAARRRILSVRSREKRRISRKEGQAAPRRAPIDSARA